jgi:hypothetical protein
VTAQAPVRLLAAAAMGVASCQAAAATEEDVSACSTAAAAEPALQQADGTLRHLFSVSFTADRSILATVTGLVTMGVARTATGGELEIAFPPGVPYPRGAASVTIREVPDPKNRSIYDHLARPPGIPERQGHTIVTSHRIAGRPTQYLIVWRNQDTGEHSVTLFDASNPDAPEPVIARSRSPILGIAWGPSAWAADYYVTAWTMAEAAGGSGNERQAMAEAYVWRPADS